MKRWISFLLIGLMVWVISISALAKNNEPFELLLLGTDDLGHRVSNDEKMSRADAIYVLKIFPDHETIKLLGIERDYLVTLPDDIGQNKLATATFFGGPEMCLNAINQLFQLSLRLYVQLDIENAITAIDTIGGLDLTIHEDEVEAINHFIDGMLSVEGVKHVKPGENHLNGHETWAFMGYRDQEIDSIESNSQRNDRQRRVIKAGLEKLHTLSLSEAMDIVEILLPRIQTNLSASELLALVHTIQSCPTEELSYLRSPVSSYQRKRAGMHHVIVAEDMSKEIDIIHAFLSK